VAICKRKTHEDYIYLILLIISNVIYFLEPLILAKIINIIQIEGITDENIIKLLKIIYCS